MKNKHKDYFFSDQNYSNWKGWNKNNFSNLDKKTKEYFQKQLSKAGLKIVGGSKVLEIGYGNGKFLRYGLDQRWKIVGVEINPQLIDLGRSNGFDVIHADELANIASCEFDAIVAFDVLEHISAEELKKFFSLIFNKLQKGGLFIARFPNGDSPFGLSNQNGDLTHISSIGRGKIEYLANLVNGEIIYFDGQATVIFSNNIFSVIRKIIALPIKKIIDYCVYFVFYPKKNYSAENLIVVIKK